MSITGVASTKGGNRTLLFGGFPIHLGSKPLFDEATSNRPTYKKLCPEHKLPLSQSLYCNGGHHKVTQPARGYEYEGEYIILDGDEVEGLAAQSDGIIELVAYRETLSPIYFEKPYLLFPRDAMGLPGYMMLHSFLQSGGYLLGTTIQAGTTKLFAVGYCDETATLVGYICNYAAHLRSRDAGSVRATLVAAAKPTADQMKVLRAFIKTLPNDFDLSQVRDELGERMWELVRSKAGEQVTVTAPIEHVAKHETLLEALRASVEAAEPAKPTRKRRKVSKETREKMSASQKARRKVEA